MTKFQKIAAGVAALSASASASAALPAVVATEFTAIGTQTSDIFALAYPVVLAGVGLIALIRWSKKLGGKV